MGGGGVWMRCARVEGSGWKGEGMGGWSDVGVKEWGWRDGGEGVGVKG